MKKKLVIGGCSFSDVNYLKMVNTSIGVVPHRMKTRQQVVKEEPWFPTWGEILAKELDMELVCLAKCGFGQQGIFSTIQDYVVKTDPKEIGLCIAAWSKSQRVNWQKKDLSWHDTKPNMYGGPEFWIMESLRYMYAFQTLMEQNRIPYRHFQMISLFVDYIYEVEYKDHGVPFEKVYDRCCNVIKESPYYDKMKNFIGWPIIDPGFVVGDVQIHKNWGAENRLANNLESSTFNPFNRDYEDRVNSANNKKLKDFEEKRYGRPVGIAPQNIMNHDYVISEANPHPNKKGHEWLANYIKLHGFNSQRVEEKK